MNKDAKPKKIAFITDTYMSYLNNEFLSGISEYIRKRRNYIVQLVDTLDTLFLDDYEMLHGYDGLIVNLGHEDIFKKIIATGVPVVDTGCEFEYPSVVSVDVDLEKSGSLAAEWFLQRRFRNFAFCGRAGNSSSIIVRKGFVSTVEKAGFTCSCHDLYLTVNPRKKKIVYAKLQQWLASLPHRTAVFCKSDILANRVVLECLNIGRAIPDDIAVMGRHNDAAFCTSLPLPISSVDTNIRRQGYVAMRILDEILERPVSPKRRRILRIRPLGVVERESTETWPVDPPYLAKALMLLDKSLNQRTSITSLAAAVGVPSTTLRAAFSKVLGTSIGKYELSLRMNAAQRLIKGGLLSLKEVASMTGFQTQSHFCHAYRAFYGHAPGNDR